MERRPELTIIENETGDCEKSTETLIAAVLSDTGVKETKRQGRIAHHHTDATVPHIVALPGFSFLAMAATKVNYLLQR